MGASSVRVRVGVSEGVDGLGPPVERDVAVRHLVLACSVDAAVAARPRLRSRRLAREAVGTGHHATRELIEETVRLAIESVVNGWGGPFGAVIARDGEIVARGQNRVLLTGDVTAHAEIEAIRRACEALNPAHLALVPRPDGSPDPVPARARMLMGHELYTTGAPCPMCMGAISWARLDRVYYSCDLEATRAIGFDDAFQYEDLARPPRERRIHVEHVHPELGAKAYESWLAKADRHPY